MFSLEASTTLPYEPAAVFATLASVEFTVRWQVGVTGVRRARPGHGVPPGLRLGYAALGVHHTLYTRVTAYVPPARFTYRAEAAAFALDVVLGVAPALGGARLTYQLHLTVPPAPAEFDAAQREDAERQAAALRRLLGRRAPRDLARLEHQLARRLRPAAALAPASAQAAVAPPRA